MNILVLGGSGFIGTALVTKLLALNHTVTIFDMKKSSLTHSNLTMRVGNLLEYYPSILFIQDRYDLVYHLLSETIPSTQDPYADINNVVLPTIKIIQEVANLNIELIFVSSGGTIYGPTRSDLPVSEKHLLNPQCSYGIGKMTIERYIELYARTKELEYSILRFANVYGPNASNIGRQGFIGSSLHNIKCDLPIRIWGDGTKVKDYLYIDDAVDALIAVLDIEESGTYNVGSSVGHSISQLLPIFGEVTKKGVQITYEKENPTDVNFILDSNKFTSMTMWKPKISISEGVNRVWLSL